MSNVTAVPIQPVKRAITLWIVVGVVAAVAFGIWLAFAGTDPVIAAKGSNEQFLAYNASRSGVATTPSGLQYKWLEKGPGGPHPTDADVASIEYEGRLRDGTVFDRSDQPIELPVGGVVPGFSEALRLMSKGDRMQAWIKPDLGYGSEDRRDPAGKVVIPADSILDFRIKLVGIESMDAFRQRKMREMMMQGGGMPGGMPPGAGAPPPEPQPR